MLAPADDNGMPTHCRIYSSDADARAAVDDLLAAGHAGADIRVLMGSHNTDDAPEGAFAGMPGVPGAFAGEGGAPRSYGGDVESRRGGFGEIDRETVTSYQDGVPHVRIASHRNLKQMLVDAGLDPAAAEKDVAALHAGRVLVLVRDAALVS
jgi:hypothetical protein